LLLKLNYQAVWQQEPVGRHDERRQALVTAVAVAEDFRLEKKAMGSDRQVVSLPEVRELDRTQIQIRSSV
jgi:hypothetical protein